MAREVPVPELGENVEEAEVLSVLVSEGEEVKADQPLFELETDKATFEMPSPAAGVVKAIRVSPGDTVEVGQVVAVLEEAADDAEAEAEPEAGKAERAERGPEPEAEVASDAEASAEPEAEVESEAEARDEPRPADEERASRSGAVPAPAAPSVRRLARELGIDIDAVEGSGPEGRIASEDVTRHARAIIERAGTRRSRPAGPRPLPDFTAFGEVEREPLSGIRRRTSENLTRSWLAIPHVAQHDRADVTELERARKRLAPRAEQEGARLTLTAIAVKVAASALTVFPRFNASLDPDNDEAVFKKYVHIGVAVDTEHGLLVPVVRDADRKSLVEIATELRALSERARKRKARPEDLRGSCFTVTNLGGLGTTTFAPLVQWPEVAVLGLGRASPELRPGEDGPETRLLLPLSISYDHRWIDGADAARFLRWVGEALESPLLLSLGA